MNAHVNVIEAERWAAALGGAALAAWGVKQLRNERSPAGAMIAAAGASLIVRGAMNPSRTETRDRLAGSRGILVDRAITIDRRPEELYAFWRQLEQLPRFMPYLISVSPINPRRSHWIAKAPGGTVEWDAEIIADIANELISWRTLEKADVVSAGSVRFKPAPGNRGTEVHVRMQYDPPLGKAGSAIAAVLGYDPASLINEDLRRLKELFEAGEIPTIEGQPRGRRSLLNYS